MYAYKEGYTEVHIRSDSQWAINAITGRWKTKHHEEMITLAKNLTKLPHFKVRLHWVKAHSGVEGNERADVLASKGRLSDTRVSTMAPLPEFIEQGAPAANSTEEWQAALKEAAKQTFHTKTTTRTRPWITDSTLAALAAARQAEAAGEAEAKSLRNAAKRSARRTQG